jgi:DNA-binding SARP family transcriptional activator/tetratricopeptide (TPR) repeat protein
MRDHLAIKALTGNPLHWPPTGKSVLRLNLLGSFQVSCQGQEIRLASRKSEALLLYVAAQRKQRVSSDEIVSVLWSDVTCKKARHSLAQSIYTINRRLGMRLFSSEKSAIIATNADIDTDVEELDRTGICGASSLIRGPVVAGFEVQHSAAFNIWLEGYRSSINALLAAVGRDALRELEAEERYDVVVQVADALLKASFLEDVAVKRVRALAAAGHLEEAKHASRVLLRLLAEEHGQPPSADTTRLIASLRNPQAGMMLSRRADVLPFVGRRVELAHLERMLMDADSGCGAVACILGEPGIGKSRLADRFLKTAALRGARLFLGKCWEGQSHVPYGVLVDLLRSTVRSQELARLPIQWRTSILEVLPEFAEDEAVPPLPGLSHAGNQQRLAEGIALLLREIGEGQVLVLFIDDVQWADPSTCFVLRYVATRAHDLRLLLVLGARNGQRNRPIIQWITSDAIESHNIELSELEPGVVEELLAKLERRTGSLTRELAEAVRRVGGQPQCIQEVIGSWTSASYRGTRWALSPIADELASTLAVFGLPMSIDMARNILMVSGLVLTEDAISESVRCGLTVCDNGYIQFSHDTLRERTYRALTSLRRRLLHHRVATYAAQRSLPPGIAAQHFSRAGDAHPAFHHALAAARQSEAVSACAEAADYLGLAAANAPSSAEALDLRFRQAVLLYRTKQLEAAERLFTSVESEMSSTNADPRVLFEVRSYLAEIESATWGGAEPNPVERLWALRRSFPEQASDDAVLRTLTAISMTCQRRAVTEGVEDIIRELILIAERAQSAACSVRAREMASSLIARHKNRRAGLRLAREVVRDAVCACEPLLRVQALKTLGGVLLNSGRLQEADSTFRRAMAEIEGCGAVIALPGVLNDAGVAKMELGLTAEARQFFDEAIEVGRDPHFQHQRTFSWVNLAILCYENEQTEEARERTEEILGREDPQSDRTVIATARAIAGLISLERHQLNDAFRHRDALYEMMSGRFVGEVSYTTLFLTRILFRSGLESAALRRLNEALSQTRRSDLLAFYRLLLERAELARDAKLDSTRLMARIRRWSRARGAELIRRRLDTILATR